MEPGRLRHRICVQNFTTSRNPSGQIIEHWQDGEPISAEVKGISGRELMTSGAETAQATIRVWMRSTDIHATSKIKVLSGPYKGRELNVIGTPIPDRTGRRLEVLCREGTVK